MKGIEQSLQSPIYKKEIEEMNIALVCYNKHKYL